VPARLLTVAVPRPERLRDGGGPPAVLAIGRRVIILDAPYYILYGETLLKYSRGRLNDSTAGG
jgi:hypothetical protein